MPTTKDNSIVTKGILRYFYEKLSNNINTLLGKKVDKVNGKGLSTNDFTTAYKNKLDGIATGANKYVLPVANDSSLGGIKTGFTQTEKQYAVEVTEEGQAYVTVPWTDTVYTLPEADTDTLGGVKLGYTQNDRNYPVLKDSEGNIYVAVPWTEFNLQTAGPDTLGGIKTGYEQQGQNYPVDTDIEGNAYVTVPWSDTGYQPATPQTDGLMSAQDKGRLDDLYEWYQNTIQGSATVLIKRSSA